MAERRMFAKTIIDSDAFLDMPITARLLYYDLGMRADDDGFVNSPKKIMRITGASQDDMSILIAKKYIIPFDNGIVVIKHWRIHNYIRKDTYTESTYTDQRNELMIDDKGAYTTNIEDGVQYLSEVTGSSRTRNDNVDGSSTQVRIGKDSEGKDSKEQDNNSCQSEEDIFIYFPLIGNETYPITKDSIQEWQKIYIGINVEQEFRNMCGWLIANPTKRKTKRGISRFINSWLARAQDGKGGRQQQRIGANGVRLAKEEDHTLDGIL